MAELSQFDAELLAQDLPGLAQAAIASSIYSAERGQLEYRAAGSESNPTVLMLHGLGPVRQDTVPNSPGFREIFVRSRGTLRASEAVRRSQGIARASMTTPRPWRPSCARFELSDFPFWLAARGGASWRWPSRGGIRRWWAALFFRPRTSPRGASLVRCATPNGTRGFAWQISAYPSHVPRSRTGCSRPIPRLW